MVVVVAAVLLLVHIMVVLAVKVETEEEDIGAGLQINRPAAVEEGQQTMVKRHGCSVVMAMAAMVVMELRIVFLEVLLLMQAEVAGGHIVDIGAMVVLVAGGEEAGY